MREKGEEGEVAMKGDRRRLVQSRNLSRMA